MLIIPVLLVIGALALIAALVAKAEGPNWNAPEPVIMRLPFPSPQEAAAKAVAATADEKAEGMGWITEFLKPEAIPPGLNERLLAVRNAIPAEPGLLFRSRYRDMAAGPRDVTRMTSGFVAKYKAAGYAFQVMETRSYVKLALLDLSDAPAKASEAERVALVGDIVRRFLVPQPADPFIINEHSAQGTFGWWSPTKRTELPNGRFAWPHQAASVSPFVDILFATDGKGVILEAYKNLPDPMQHRKPRFSALAPPPG